MELSWLVPDGTNKGRNLKGSVLQKVECDAKKISALKVSGKKDLSVNSTSQIKVYGQVDTAKNDNYYQIIDGLTSTSSDPDVAEMDAQGKIKAKSAGKTEITVTEGSASTSFEVYVGDQDQCNHDFGGWQLDEDDTDHEMRRCRKCGKVELRDHPEDQLTYTDNDEDGHTVKCSYCGLNKTEEHTYTGAYDDDWGSYGHIKKCKCGAESLENHTYGDVKEDPNDDDEHYKQCKGCGYKLYLSHDYGDWSYDEDTNTSTRTCKTCGHIQTEGPKDHDWSCYQYLNQDYCQSVCQNCGAIEKHKHVIDYENNRDGKTHRKYCKYCHTDLDKNEDHDYGEWTYDYDNQVATRKCKSCNYIQTCTDHDFGDWEYGDEDHCKRVCKICGLTEEKEHNIKYANNYAGTHSKKCDDCGHTIDDEEHIWGEANKKDDNYHTAKCQVCGAVEDVAHNYGTHQVEKIKDDDTNHYVICDDCGYKKKEAHDFGDWTYDEEKQVATRTCQTCGYVQTEKDHDYDH